MTAEEFSMLSENIDDVDFLQPVLVVPSKKREDGKQMFRIIDGEQRYEAQRFRDKKTIPCIVADEKRLPEIKQKFQTVRFNKIKGTINSKKFNALVSDIMKSEEYSFEQIAHEFGFVDEDEFQLLLDAARESLPTDEMKEEFDKAKEELKTVDDLSLLVNRLFTKFGDTLPANFMIIDFGGKEHIWVRMKRAEYKKVRGAARECMAHGITFDSLLSRVLSVLPIDKFVLKHRDLLEEIKADSTSIDELITKEEIDEHKV